MTVEEFCERYALSRSHYYDLKKRGLTPDEFRIGRKALITAASARAWERHIQATLRAEQTGQRNRPHRQK